MTFIKKYLPLIIGVAVLLGGLLLTARACKITDPYSKLKGAYEEARKVAEADHALQLKAIEAAQKVIADKDKAIADSTKEIGYLTNSIGQKNADLLNLEQTLTQAKTDAERVPILTSMVETWRGKYAALEGVVAEKDTQLAAWGAKFAAQVTIGDSWKAQYEAEHRLRLSGETLLGKLETKYRVLKFTSSVKSMVVIAAAGFIGYTLIKKGK